VVEVELPLASDLERVREPGRGDEPRRRSAALDEGVGEERRRVHDPFDPGRVDGAVAKQAGHARRDGARRVVVGREDLAVDLRPGVVVVDDEVGEGAADVDAERATGHGVEPTISRGLDSGAATIRWW